MEYITQAIDFINRNSGIVALLAVIVSIYIYRRQRCHDKKAMQDELDAIDESSRFPMSDGERQRYIRRYVLEKGLKKKKR